MEFLVSPVELLGEAPAMDQIARGDLKFILHGEKLNGEFALVLSDIRMPSMNGVQFLEWLTAHRPDLLPKTVFMTGDGRSSDLNAKIESAGHPVLRKPFTLDTLLKVTTGILTPPSSADAPSI